jgi:molybdate transport system substrate-binding protein
VLRRIGLVGMAAVVCSVAGCRSQPADAPGRLIVRGGPLLRDVFTELGSLFESRHPDIALRTDFSCPPCVLANRAADDMEVDVFVAAGDAELAVLAASGILDPSTTTAIGSTRLVVVVPEGNPHNLGRLEDLDRAEIKSIVVGDPDLTSPGQYVRQAFEKTGLWEKLAGKLVLTKTGCEALKMVAVGHCDAALVYGFCLEEEAGRPEVVAEVPAQLHDPILISLTLGTARTGKPALGFVEFMHSPEAQEILRKHGVGPVPESVSSTPPESDRGQPG